MSILRLLREPQAVQPPRNKHHYKSWLAFSQIKRKKTKWYSILVIRLIWSDFPFSLYAVTCTVLRIHIVFELNQSITRRPKRIVTLFYIQTSSYRQRPFWLERRRKRERKNKKESISGSWHLCCLLFSSSRCCGFVQIARVFLAARNRLTPPNCTIERLCVLSTKSILWRAGDTHYTTRKCIKRFFARVISVVSKLDAQFFLFRQSEHHE